MKTHDTTAIGDKVKSSGIAADKRQWLIVRSKGVGDVKILLNGEPLTCVRSLNFELRAGKLASATLELIPDEIHFEGDCQITIFGGIPLSK